MIHITINPRFVPLVDTEQIEQLYSKAISYLDLHDVDVSVIFEADQILRKLNLEYRNLDQPTDVLSFEMGNSDPETGNRYLGDIVISVDTAKRQAHQRGIPLMSEVSLLFVHGLLHLCDYDHAEEEGKREMWALQGQILKLVGLDLNLNDLDFPEL